MDPRAEELRRAEEELRRREQEDAELEAESRAALDRIRRDPRVEGLMERIKQDLKPGEDPAYWDISGPARDVAPSERAESHVVAAKLPSPASPGGAASTSAAQAAYLLIATETGYQVEQLQALEACSDPAAKTQVGMRIREIRELIERTWAEAPRTVGGGTAQIARPKEAQAGHAAMLITDAGLERALAERNITGTDLGVRPVPPEALPPLTRHAPVVEAELDIAEGSNAPSTPKRTLPGLGGPAAPGSDAPADEPTPAPLETASPRDDRRDDALLSDSWRGAAKPAAPRRMLVGAAVIAITVALVAAATWLTTNGTTDPAAPTSAEMPPSQEPPAAAPSAAEPEAPPPTTSALSALPEPTSSATSRRHPPSPVVRPAPSPSPAPAASSAAAPPSSAAASVPTVGPIPD